MGERERVTDNRGPGGRTRTDAQGQAAWQSSSARLSRRSARKSAETLDQARSRRVPAVRDLLVPEEAAAAWDALTQPGDDPAGALLDLAEASRCYLSVCVGHASEREQICTAGLDEVVETVHDRLRAYEVNIVHFLAGGADLADDALVSGEWDAALDVGAGERATPAVFTGLRR